MNDVDTGETYLFLFTHLGASAPSDRRAALKRLARHNVLAGQIVDIIRIELGEPHRRAVDIDLLNAVEVEAGICLKIAEKIADSREWTLVELPLDIRGNMVWPYLRYEDMTAPVFLTGLHWQTVYGQSWEGDRVEFHFHLDPQPGESVVTLRYNRRYVNLEYKRKAVAKAMDLLRSDGRISHVDDIPVTPPPRTRR
jgi:hypothetical protein